MLLSPHFSYEEMTITQVRGVDNTPSAEVLASLDCMDRVQGRVDQPAPEKLNMKAPANG